MRVSKERYTKTTFCAVFCAFLLSSCFAGKQVKTVALESRDLSVEKIEFDPLQQGMNRVTVDARNATDSSQVFAIHIQSRGRRLGWGRPFFEHLDARESRRCVFEFEIREPVWDDSWVRLQFYNPPSEEGFEFEEYFRQEKYVGAGLERYRAAPPEVRDAVIGAYEGFRKAFEEGDWERLWELTSANLKGDDFEQFEREFGGRRDFFAAMLRGQEPREVQATSGSAVLTALRDGLEWKVQFLPEEGGWKFQGMSEPPEVDLGQMALEAAVVSMEKRSTAHFDIYYEIGSRAARDIEQIARRREEGLQQIVEFLGLESEKRITVVFFADPEVKQQQTGHQGAGWAFGTNIVEVYNDETRLDPYHEMTHVLARALGDPPAILNEGLATYMSERMGEPALNYLGSGDLSLYEGVRELKGRGEWIDLDELLTYTDIGPAWSKPRIAYAEAGAFVKFLVETFGEERFARVYGRLRNSMEEGEQRINREALEEIYGLSLERLRERWYAAAGLDAL